MKNKCSACAFSGMEPDDDLVCYHPDLLKINPYGLYVRYTDNRHFPACGPESLKFEQHPDRTEDGRLKSGL